MLKITKDGKKIATLKDDASEPEMEIVVPDKNPDKLSGKEESKEGEKPNDDME
jgi:hypothetical protein